MKPSGVTWKVQLSTNQGLALILKKKVGKQSSNPEYTTTQMHNKTRL